MPKKSPKTATGGKRKATPGDKKGQQHKEGDQEDLETLDKEGVLGKRKKSNASTICGTSIQTLSQASASPSFPEEGKFN